MNLRPLLIAIAACAVFFGEMLATRTIEPLDAFIAARIDGSFPLNGHFAGQPLPHTKGVRFWGSWAGGDPNTGTIALGPFPAPVRLRFAIGGYPTQPGNEIFVALAGTTSRLPVKIHWDIGERWVVKDFYPPADWVGKPITLHARDGATGHGGWLAISEPLARGHGGGHGELFATLAAWSINGLLLGLLWLAILRHVTAHAWVAPHWAPLVAAGLVAACAYLAFWIYFAHAPTGRAFSVALLALGAIGALRRRKSNNVPTVDATAAPRLLVALGLFYVTLLHFAPSSREFYELAANRFREGLPGDNNLPHYVADFLYRGEPLKHPGEDWLSSDRPPLQTGWLMLTRPVNDVLQLDERTFGGTTAIWLQSIWVFAAYGLFRSLGLARARACAWIALLAVTGFFAQNTVFTWPKLSAAAFAAGTFALWLWPRGARPERNLSEFVAPASAGTKAPILPPQGGATNPEQARPTTAEYLLGGLLAVLAWLSHGGVAFSFLLLAPWIAWRLVAALYERRGSPEWRGFILAAVVFALFAAPWLAYQKFYDPPGNRLLKWHLAGVTAKDPRGTWQTIRESYGALTWKDYVANKSYNLRRQFEGSWDWWYHQQPAGAPQRRTEEFFFTARALTWWVLGLVALPVALALGRTDSSGRSGRREEAGTAVIATSSFRQSPLRDNWRRAAALTAWTVLTLFVWCLLMFTGGQAVIHQGSYVVMLALFVLLSCWLESASPWAIVVVAALQLYSFATTWALLNATLPGPINPLALAGTLAAAAWIAWLVFREHRTPDAT
ncbi:MAG: hypothetical protein HZA93_07075 [Verrucomicrobia bacterium]|nr:hypothetical protein [Verrucomicrobiota bacterium]